MGELLSVPQSNPSPERAEIAAVIFDLDGVLLDSEPVWEAVRREFVSEQRGHWQLDSQQRMMGMSTSEWSTYLSVDLGVAMTPPSIVAAVLDRMAQRYERHLPLIDGAVQVVRGLAAHWPLGLASSSARPLLDIALDRSQLAQSFTSTVSSDEVARGKPAPDVYLEAAKRLDTPPAQCVAVEDSSNGILSAVKAGMRLVAIPNRHYPPEGTALAAANLILGNLRQLTAASLQELR